MSRDRRLSVPKKSFTTECNLLHNYFCHWIEKKAFIESATYLIRFIGIVVDMDLSDEGRRGAFQYNFV